MGCCDDGQPVVQLDIAITTTECDAQSGNAAVNTLMVPWQERLPKLIARTTYFQSYLLRNCLANK